MTRYMRVECPRTLDERCDHCIEMYPGGVIMQGSLVAAVEGDIVEFCLAHLSRCIVVTAEEGNKVHASPLP